jgi:hypothetical protein
MPSSQKRLPGADRASTSGRNRNRRPDAAVLLAALLAACSVELAPLVADPPDASARGARSEPDAGVGGASGSASGGSAGVAEAGGSAGGSAGGTSGSEAAGTAGGGGGDIGDPGAAGTGAVGGTPAFECVVIGPCDYPDFASCRCDGCYTYCYDGKYYSDCVCPACAADPDCTSCNYDGLCDPAWEGCSCADCAGHPLC